MVAASGGIRWVTQKLIVLGITSIHNPSLTRLIIILHSLHHVTGEHFAIFTSGYSETVFSEHRVMGMLDALVRQVV